MLALCFAHFFERCPRPRSECLWCIEAVARCQLQLISSSNGGEWPTLAKLANIFPFTGSAFENVSAASPIALTLLFASVRRPLISIEQFVSCAESERHMWLRTRWKRMAGGSTSDLRHYRLSL